MSSKKSLRSGALKRRRRLNNTERRDYSRIIIQSLIQHLQQLERRPDRLLSYRALPTEVDADALFRQRSYRIYAPVTHHHEHMAWHQVTTETKWRRGCFGVLEPEGGEVWRPEGGVNVLVCPLTAFDRQGNRLGMGKGCFDYWLAENRQYIDRVIGLAFSCQEVAAVPVEGHDMPMDDIITERERIECQRP